jgi:hypothetical protein
MMEKTGRLRLAFISLLFLPTIVFLIGSFFISRILTPLPLYIGYVSRALIYLIFIALLLSAFVILLTIRPFDPVFVAAFIGIACGITLNALWGGIMEMANQAGVLSTTFVQTVMDFAYWGLQFFFTAMTPILMYIAIKLYPEKVAFSYRYLFGLMIVGVGTYITWSLVNEYRIFFIWGLENFTPAIATWFPPETWILGVPWIFWTAPLSIGLILIGYWIMKRSRKSEINEF